LLANLVFIPLFTVCVVPLVLLSVGAVLTGQGGLADFTLHLVGEVFSLSWPWLEWLAGHVPALSFPASSWPIVLLAGVGAVYLLAPGWPGRWLGLFMVLPILLPIPKVLAEGDARILVLDVGQGLAVVIETASHLMVYDPGPRYASGADAGNRTVIPYLASRGKHTVDLIMVSHGDSDHSGGLESLRKAYPGAQILAGGGERQPVATESCRRGQHWRWDDVDFRVLHPDGPGWQGNDASCVLLIQTAAGSVLLAGDIQAPAENSLRNTVGRVDVALVTHHGSATSSTEAWVSALCARLAIVSSGYRNRWGFPRREVVERWRASGAVVLDTGHSGAISLLLTAADGLTEVSRTRAESLRVWRIVEEKLYPVNGENKGFEVSGSGPGAVSCREFDSS
jgi:competence protein ComEC